MHRTRRPLRRRKRTPQAEDASTLDEVIVTGFRASLQSAINSKRRESGVVDVIKAEDIADFPDLNLAESLQRIPGVVITRANGEGRQISVRGLGSEYTRVRVNGMEAIATTGGTVNSGGANRTRGFDFNMFASELFNSLTVRKTASADVEEGSLGATVDLQTARPFDYTEPTFVVWACRAATTIWPAIVTAPLHDALASQHLDGRPVRGADSRPPTRERHILEEGANITRWSAGGANGGFNAALSTVAGLHGRPDQQQHEPRPQVMFHPRMPAYVQLRPSTTERLGLTGALQFRPDDQSTITLDVLYSDVQSTRDEAQLQAIGLSRGGARASRRPSSVQRHGRRPTTSWSGAMDNGRCAHPVGSRRAGNRVPAVHPDGQPHDWTDRLRTGFVGGYSNSFSSTTRSRRSSPSIARTANGLRLRLHVSRHAEAIDARLRS
jgi:iron complex outermembrane receptor protein